MAIPRVWGGLLHPKSKSVPVLVTPSQAHTGRQPQSSGAFASQNPAPLQGFFMPAIRRANLFCQLCMAIVWLTILLWSGRGCRYAAALFQP